MPAVRCGSRGVIRSSRNKEKGIIVNAAFKFIGACLTLFVLVGCATTPPPEQKKFVNQAIWPETTTDQVYSACMAALNMESYAIHPTGTNKDVGLIVTKPREFPYTGFNGVTCYYTLQVMVVPTRDKKVMVNVNAVEAGYKFEGKYGPPENYAKRHVSDTVAVHIDGFFAQLDTLLGKAEMYKQDKVLFEVK